MVDIEKIQMRIEARGDELAALVQKWLNEDSAAPDVTAADTAVVLLTTLSRQTAVSAVICGVDRESLLEGMGQSYDISEPVVRDAVTFVDSGEAAGG
jgi:hypothetical protein